MPFWIPFNWLPKKPEFYDLSGNKKPDDYELAKKYWDDYKNIALKLEAIERRTCDLESFIKNIKNYLFWGGISVIVSAFTFLAFNPDCVRNVANFVESTCTGQKDKK